jgi:hypothetical protein
MSESDSYSPVLLTMDSQGRITAEFQGHVIARGIDLPEGVGNILADPEQPDSKVEWKQDGASRGYVLVAHDSTFDEHELRLVATGPGAGGAKVTAYVGDDPDFPGNQGSAVLIDSNSNSSFGHTTVQNIIIVQSGNAPPGIEIGGDVNLYRVAANQLKTDDALVVTGALTMSGALDHNGTSLGFYGAAPKARQTGWTATTQNNRNADAATAIAGLQDVVQTLVADLKAYGLLAS